MVEEQPGKRRYARTASWKKARDQIAASTCNQGLTLHSSQSLPNLDFEFGILR